MGGNHGTKREGDVASLCESTEEARILCPITCNSCQSEFNSLTPSLLPSSLPISLPSFSPSITVSPSSSHSMYECVDDVKNESIFEYSGKWYGCERLSKKKEVKVVKICTKSNDLRKLCPITCDSCLSLAPSSLPSKSLSNTLSYAPLTISSTKPSSSFTPSIVLSNQASVYQCKDNDD